MKKVFLLISLSVLILTPVQAQGALVPCGYDVDENGIYDSDLEGCKFCHIFTLIDNILDFLLIKIVLPVAALMFIIGGFFLLISRDNPETLKKAKNILTATVIGLVIIFAAFLFVGTFLEMIGLAGWTENFYQNWWNEGFFQFPCIS